MENLKPQWNAVLDSLLDSNRIAWLAFFDARLVSLEAEVLTINFSDSQKFGGDHDFAIARNPEHFAQLIDSIKEVTGTCLEVVES